MEDRNNENMELYPAALTIAGSDSGGGAGIEADLRTFNSYGIFGCAAISAVTAQNPREVRRIDALAPESVRCQIETVLDAIPVRAAKTGMLANAGIVRAVAETIRKRKLPVVVDPVMVSTSGKTLLEPEAVRSVIEELIPTALWITPNLPEAELLTGRKLASEAEIAAAAVACAEEWGINVLLKTGHAPGAKTVTDFVVLDGELYALSSPRVQVESVTTHGTGCTLSAALTAGLAFGMSPEQALCEAKAFICGSLRETVQLSGSLAAMYPPTQDCLGQVRLEKYRKKVSR